MLLDLPPILDPWIWLKCPFSRVCGFLEKSRDIISSPVVVQQEFREQAYAFLALQILNALLVHNNDHRVNYLEGHIEGRRAGGNARNVQRHIDSLEKHIKAGFTEKDAEGKVSEAWPTSLTEDALKEALLSLDFRKDLKEEDWIKRGETFAVVIGMLSVLLQLTPKN